MKQITFFRCFQAEVSFIGLEHLTEKMTAVASFTRVRVMVDRTRVWVMVDRTRVWVMVDRTRVWVMVDRTLPNKNKALALIFGSV